MLDKTFVFCYDSIGNISSVESFPYTTGSLSAGTGTIQRYTYNSAYPDRLATFNGKSISYNNLGCPQYYDNKTWTWTKGKLTRIHRGSSSQPGSKYEDCTFTYDAYGRRTQKYYIYDPNPAVAGDGHYYYKTNYNYDESGRLIREFCTEYRDTGTTTTREFVYLYDESGIIGVMYSVNGAGAQPYFYRRNLQGDVIAIYDQTGSRKVEYAYDAFGNCKVIQNASDTDIAFINPIRYRGYYYDTETQLYYLNARYYNPEWRRFISPDDTAYLTPKNPIGLNLYAYCNNDPINKLDPSGHFVITTTVILAAMGIGAAIGASIGFGAAYVPDVIDNIKNDGFQWSDFNTFENNWLHYVGATLGGAISGAGIGLCSVLGAGLGVALSAGTALSIGGTAISGGTALALGIGGAYVTGGLGYAVRTGISNQENFDLADMFIDATSNAISGMLTFGGALVGGIVGIKVPGSEFILKDFVLYHLLAASLGVYPLKAILAFIKSKLKESN